MKNFQNYKAAKYADTEKFTEVEEGIYRTKDPYGTDEVYVTSLTFELEKDDPFEEDGSPEYPPQAPFEDLLDEFLVHVTDFYEAENEASEIICYQEFGSPDIEDIRNLRTIIGKRFYAADDPEDEDSYIIKIEDEGQTAETPEIPAVDDPEDEDNCIIKIEGETNPDDFGFEDSESDSGVIVISRYRGSDKEVFIPSEIGGKPVRKIGFRAFAECGDLESVVIPEGVEEIICYAFEDCKKLKNIVIPESVTIIGGRAFKNTPWLKKLRAKNPLVIVNGVVIDGKSCKGDVVIPEGVRAISSDAFNNNRALTSVVIPEGVTVIDHRAFQECKALTSVTIPSTVTMIGERAFDDCKKLENMNVPDSVEELWPEPFAGTLWLENKRRETPLVIVGRYLLDGRGCKGGVEIPDGVTHICQKAFYYCRELTSVIIPESVTEIGRYAFQGCSALEEVELEYGLTKICDCAFHSCAVLKEIDLPASLTEIGECAFYDCESLEEADIPDEVAAIASGTFRGCTSLERAYLGDNVTAIGSSAFKECTSLRLVQFPDSLESIEKNAFEGCIALENLSFPNNVSEICEKAFMNCAALKEVYLPKSLGVLCYSTFENCTSLEEVHFEDGLRVIGTYAFFNCCMLEELDLPDTLKQINPMAFEGCASLREVELPERVFYFYLSAFKGTNCTVTFGDKEYKFVNKNPAENIKTLNNEDKIYADIFGKVTEVEVISTGDNQYDEDGNHKPDGFALSEREITALNDFLKNVELEDFVEQITEYCNERYEENGEEPIEDYTTQHVITINTIAVNVRKGGGEDEPEIALIGDCDCDEENGICIGFRNGELVGIEQQDWLL